MNRRQARETAFLLIFEASYHSGEDPLAIYENAKNAREIKDDDYVKEVFLGVCENRASLDALIEKYSRGWKAERISTVSRSAMELCAYEMMYRKDIPVPVSLNEALELVKTYDEESARAFVNGVLNAIADEAKATRDAE